MMGVGRQIAAQNLKVLQAYRENLLVNRPAAPIIPQDASPADLGTRVQIDQPVRLDLLLAKRFGVTSSLLGLLIRRRMIRVERMRVDGEREEVRGLRDPKSSLIRPWFPLRSGDLLSLPTVRLRELNKNATDGQVILFENEKLVALDKPAGKETMSLYRGLPPVWSLDREVSGIVLYAKQKVEHARLTRLLGGATGSLKPRIHFDYLAMVLDRPQFRTGRIMTNLYTRIKARLLRAQAQKGEAMDGQAQDGSNLKAMETEAKESKVGQIATTVAHRRSNLLDEGRVAVTVYKHLADHIRKDAQGKRHKLSLLRLTPLTGHPHQLRVHCAEILACPILGDHLYGWRYRQQPRMLKTKLHLHLHRVRIDGELEIKAGLSERLMNTMDRYPLFLRAPPKRA